MGGPKPPQPADSGNGNMIRRMGGPDGGPTSAGPKAGASTGQGSKEWHGFPGGNGQGGSQNAPPVAGSGAAEKGRAGGTITQTPMTDKNDRGGDRGGWTKFSTPAGRPVSGEGASGGSPAEHRGGQGLSSGSASKPPLELNKPIVTPRQDGRYTPPASSSAAESRHDSQRYTPPTPSYAPESRHDSQRYTPPPSHTPPVYREPPVYHAPPSPPSHSSGGSYSGGSRGSSSGSSGGSHGGSSGGSHSSSGGSHSSSGSSHSSSSSSSKSSSSGSNKHQ